MRSLIQIKNLKAGLSSDMSELKVLMIEMLSSHFVKMFHHLNTVKKAIVEIRQSSTKKNDKACYFLYNFKIWLCVRKANGNL